MKFLIMLSCNHSPADSLLRERVHTFQIFLFRKQRERSQHGASGIVVD
jgi:hypothetical protein